MNFATKSIDITHLTLGMLLHYLRKLKIQIFCRYSAEHVDAIVSNAASRVHFLKQLKRAGVPIRDLLHFYTAIIRLVLERACLFWHSGLTAGQCSAIENIQKRAVRVIYSDTDSDYEIALIVTRMDSLKDRCEMLMARFF